MGETTTGPDKPLSEAETKELSELLEAAKSPPLPFARGVMSAVATAPSPFPAAEWLPLVLGDAVPDRPTLRRLMSLLVREGNACATCLELGVPVVPGPEASDEVRDFCRGYVQLAQRDSAWTKDEGAFELMLPLALIAGYATPASIAAFAPDAGDDPESYAQRHIQQLPDQLANLHAHTAPTRARRAARAAQAQEKVGRNDPCPCGSGKKYKKCCGAE